MSEPPHTSSNSAPAPRDTTELPTRYVPSEHETRVWDAWVAAKAFHADPAAVNSGKKKPSGSHKPKHRPTGPVPDEDGHATPSF